MKRNGKRRPMRRARGEEVDGNSPTINLHQTESKFCEELSMQTKPTAEGIKIP